MTFCWIFLFFVNAIPGGFFSLSFSLSRHWGVWLEPAGVLILVCYSMFYVYDLDANLLSQEFRDWFCFASLWIWKPGATSAVIWGVKYYHCILTVYWYSLFFVVVFLIFVSHNLSEMYGLTFFGLRRWLPTSRLILFPNGYGISIYF